MNVRLPAARACAIAAAFVLSSCGGGGGSPGDVRTSSDPPPVTACTSAKDTSCLEPDSFLLFPNPQKQADGTLQTNTSAYADAYYAAIDPDGRRTTLDKWKVANGFGSGNGEELTVVFGDRRDLGYGRLMTARRNPDGTLAFYVENYLVVAAAGYTYNPLNLEAAVQRDRKHVIGVNAIEYSPGPAGGAPFPKWYNFNAATGERNTFVDLDNRGDKAMPGPCISCHGGRGDALTPPDATGKPRFNLVRNSTSQARGDVTGRLHPFEADAFDFSTLPGATRAEQEAAIKKINSWILCTYPLRGASSFPEDQCRPQATASEWQGTAAALIKAAYGGDGLPGATFSDHYVPASWVTAGQSTLYTNVIAPSCRTCHSMRGTGGNSDIDFDSFAKFESYADRIKAHVFERGNMPLAKIVYDAFWDTPGRAETLARFLTDRGYTVPRDASGTLARPGSSAVANAGPDRVVSPGTTRLSAAMSLYAQSYAWSIVSGPPGASLADAATETPTFTASANGTYVLELVASNCCSKSAPARLTLVVDGALSPAPSSIRFADIKAAIQSSTCQNCHSPTGTLPRPPVYYTNEDRNGDGVAGDATDDAWYYAELRGRINFTDLAASPLLRKPAGHAHGGSRIPGFDTTQPPGSPARAKYDLFLNWILAGAPQ